MSNSSYQVVTLSDYVSPKLHDEQGKKWVLWGVNNSFYEHLRNLYLNSTTNNGAINGIVKLCYGDGLTWLNTQDKAKAEELVSEKDMKRAILQFYIYNKLCLQLEYHMINGSRDTKKGIKKAYFFPANQVGIGRKNDDGDVEMYYVSENWTECNKEKYRPKPVPAYGFGSAKDEIELYLYQEQYDGDEYFAPVAYHGCLQFAECEIEASNYHLNHLINGFAPNCIINMNNGVPDEDTRKRITRDIVNSKAGSKNAGKAFITFNDSSDNAVTIASYDIPDPHEQYQFIDTLAEKKILFAHNVTSPLLLGVRDTSGGLGSNANEIREAYELMNAMTLQPLRNNFLLGMEPIFLSAGIATMPEFIQLELFTKEIAVPNEAAEAPVDQPDVAEPASSDNTEDVQMQADNRPVMIKEDEVSAIAYLDSKGEIIGNEWGVFSEALVDDPDAEDSLLQVLMNSTEPADGQPQERSEGDTGLFKVRYRYGGDPVTTDSREFCVYMMQRAAAGIVYSKEDIDSWEGQQINGQFAPRGETKYSIWRFKGGCYCHHQWYRVIYFRKRNPDGTFMPASTDPSMSNDRRVSQPQARAAGIPEEKLNPEGWPDAGTKPIDMPNRGKLN
jgi:hypothetical protein